MSHLVIILVDPHTETWLMPGLPQLVALRMHSALEHFLKFVARKNRHRSPSQLRRSFDCIVVAVADDDVGIPFNHKPFPSGWVCGPWLIRNWRLMSLWRCRSDTPQLSRAACKQSKSKYVVCIFSIFFPQTCRKLDLKFRASIARIIAVTYQIKAP